MKKSTRILALAMALLLCLAAIPALAEDAEKGPLYIEGSEGVTLTYWIPLGATQAQYYSNLNEHPFYQWLEEQTGVHIEFIHPSEEQMTTQFTLMMASGNYSDLMYQVEYPDGPQAGVDDGVFVDLNKYADIMPNYQAALNCSDGSLTAWEWGEEKDLYGIQYKPAYITNAKGAAGALWCCTQIVLEGDSVYRGCLIRRDWLDEAGLEMPETVDELEVVLEAFKQRGSDVIPMNLTNTAMQGGCGVLCNMFDIYPSWYTVDSNQQIMVPGFVDDNAKDYFALMNKWYEAGYIDPDFMNRGDVGEGWNSLLLSDRLGILIDTQSTPESYEAAYTGDQKFDLEAMPMPRLTKDQQLHFNGASTESRVNCYTVMTESCKNQEIAAKWLDTLFTKEAYLRANYGVENESYVLDENGVPYFTDWYYHNDTYDVATLRAIYLVYDGGSWGTAYSGLYSKRSAAYLGTVLMDTDKQKTTVPDNVATSAVWSQHSDNSLAVGWVTFEGDSWGQMYDPYTEAATYANAMALKFITGVEPLSNFEAYQKKALEMGFALSRDKMQEAYDAYHAGVAAE